jgi:hypothetical protein
MAPDRIGVCSTAVAEHTSGAIGWGATQQECDGTKDAQARGTGKVPSFKGRKAYLSRCRTTRRAKSCWRLSRGCLRETDQPWGGFVCTGVHVAHVLAWRKLGTCLMTCPFYDQIGESWSDSEGIPWGFHSIQMVGIPLRTPGLLQSHRASWVRLRTIMTQALCLEDMMRLAHHSWTMKDWALSLDDSVGAAWADPRSISSMS